MDRLSGAVREKMPSPTKRVRRPSASERPVPSAPGIEPDIPAVPRSVSTERPSGSATPTPQARFRHDGPDGEAVAGTAAFVAAHFRFVRNDLPGVSVDGSRPEPHREHAEREAWETRIRELRRYAAEDGEPFNEASERDLRVFLRSNPSARKDALVLAPNGNLRAVWRRDAGAHLGAEFRGGGVVQFVVFRRRSDAGPISRAAGRDDFEGFKRQAAAFDLDFLLYE